MNRFLRRDLRRRLRLCLAAALLLPPFLWADVPDDSRGFRNGSLLQSPDWQQVGGLAPPPVVAARAAVLVEAETGTILFAKNPHLVIPAASLTKVVAIHAAILADRLGEIDLDLLVQPPPESWAMNQAPGSSLMFLGPGQLLSIWQLIEGLAVSSGNDAAVALALQVDGSVSAFAQRMNAVVRAAGLVTSSFVEPSGLSPFNLTTAYEYSAFIRLHLQEFPELTDRLYARRSYTYPQERNRVAEDAGPSITQSNRNLLLGSYSGADGVKTGFIDESGYHLAATATRDGRRLIAVVLGVSAASHAEGGSTRAADAAALLDYGFDEFDLFRFGHPPIEPVRVYKGERTSVDPIGPGPLAVSVPAGAGERLRGKVEQISEVVAPVPAGAAVGMIRVSLDGLTLAEGQVT
ncbi:MAG: D-alanyl-D-alanine carboxypeptidase family protein, partial [Spirochaetia bacterium]